MKFSTDDGTRWEVRIRKVNSFGPEHQSGNILWIFFNLYQLTGIVAYRALLIASLKIKILRGSKIMHETKPNNIFLWWKISIKIMLLSYTTNIFSMLWVHPRITYIYLCISQSQFTSFQLFCLSLGLWICRNIWNTFKQ